MKASSFRLKIALLSVVISGLVLAAFGALALYLAALEILAIPYPRWRTS